MMAPNALENALIQGMSISNADGVFRAGGGGADLEEVADHLAARAVVGVSFLPARPCTRS